jgi:hypothetical protein
VRIEELIENLKASDIIPSVYLQKIDKNEAVNDNIIKVYRPGPDMSRQDFVIYKKLIEKALDNNNKFNWILQKLVVPVKFSFLALVSARKATIFSESLIELMIYVASW